jgi:hypothetical protein
MTAVQSDSYTERCSTHTASHQSSIDVLADYFADIRREQEMYAKAGCPASDLTNCLVKWFDMREQRSTALACDCVSDDIVHGSRSVGSRMWNPPHVASSSPPKPDSLPAAGGQVNVAVLCHET